MTTKERKLDNFLKGLAVTTDAEAVALAFVREEREDARQREQTAATILAALIEPMNWGSAHARWEGDRAIVERLGAGDMQHIAYAVALTDALRAELAKVGGK